MSSEGPSARSRLQSETLRLRDQAIAAMTALAGETSACARAKDGQTFPAYKFHEGRAWALGQLSRQLQGLEEDAASVIAGATATWQRQVEQCRTRGRDWQAYAAGGLDAVGSVEALLTDDGPIT